MSAAGRPYDLAVERVIPRARPLESRPAPGLRRSIDAPGLRHDAVLAALGIALLAALTSRRLDALTQPHFYAEDGTAFFAAAHDSPALQALLTPLGGYLVVFQRVVALVFTPLGLSPAAVAFAITGFAMQALPPLFFVTRRFRTIVADDRARIGMAILYVLVWNQELSGNLTNSQWHLAVLAFLVLLASPPRSLPARAFDVAVLLLSGLSGPYALVLLPIAWVMHRGWLDRWRRIELALLGSTALVQLGLLAFSLGAHDRGAVPLGISASALPYIVSNQLLVRFADAEIHSGSWVAALAVSTGALLVLACGLWRGSRALRCLIVFGLAVAGLGLLSPYGVLPRGATWWDAASSGQAVMRYFFIIAVALVAAALAAANALRRPMSRRGWTAVIVAAVVLSAAMHWGYTVAPPQHLDRYQAALAGAPRGSVVTVPIYPSGWEMRLTAR